MVSKNTAVRSIRLPNEAWEWLAAEAEKRGTTVNGLVAEGVATLRGPIIRNTASVESVPWIDEKTGQQHRFGGVGLYVDVPLHKPKPFNPQPKKGAKK